MQQQSVLTKKWRKGINLTKLENDFVYTKYGAAEIIALKSCRYLCFWLEGKHFAVLKLEVFEFKSIFFFWKLLSKWSKWLASSYFPLVTNENWWYSMFSSCDSALNYWIASLQTQSTAWAWTGLWMARTFDIKLEFERIYWLHWKYILQLN